MLINFRDIWQRYQMNVTGVIHVGAHLAEEKDAYAEMQVPKVVWVEANGEVLYKLKDLIFTPDSYGEQQLIHALITDKDGEKYDFNVSNHDGMSSSIYNFGTHVNFSFDTWHEHANQLESVTLDTLMRSRDFSGCNMFNIDIEGAGLDALRGAEELLKQMQYVYIEVQTENVYDGAPLLPEYDAFLQERGFDRVELSLVPGQGWGDSLYIRGWVDR
jgi:FkbM family methyltransferase